MAALIKKNKNPSTKSQDSQITEWSVSKTINDYNKRRRIIKAKEAEFSSEEKEIPQMRVTSDTPSIKPLRNGLVVEGVEITCSCGEKTVIHFEIEEDESHE